MHAIRVAMTGFAELEQHAAEVLGVHLVGHHGFPALLGEGLHLAPRTQALLVKRLDVGKHVRGFGTKDETHRINPMRADVTHRAEFPTFTGEHAPVVVGLMQQPILEEMPLNMNDLPEVTTLHQRPHLQHSREEAAHVEIGRAHV